MVVWTKMVAEEEVINGQMGYILETKLTGFADKQDVEYETEQPRVAQKFLAKQLEEWIWC